MDDVSQKGAERIAGFLDASTGEHSANLAFVFGTRHPDPAHISAGLFARGLVDYVVLTGGQNRGTGQQEALTHLEILRREGVPRSQIVVEEQSTNTLENVALAMPKVVAQIALEDIRAIVVIAKWYGCRRGMMTLKRHFPPGIRYYAQTYEPDVVRRADWYQHPEATRRVLKEWHSIPRYLERGDIAEIRREGDAFV
jgi:uncharacterized SAM-binding protein YcdF (DUF218 family)